MRHLKRLFVLFALASPAWAGTAPLAFEVASVRPNNGQTRGLKIEFLPGGRFVAQNLSVKVLVSIAYNLPFQSVRLASAPGTDAVLRQNYDIEATAPKGAIPVGTSALVREEKMRSMLQALLADRFKLAVQQESKDTAVYAILIAKNGPRLQKSKIEEQECPETSVAGCHQLSGGQGRGLHGNAVSLADIALYVSNWTELPTVDKTGLAGLFEVNTPGWTSMQLKEGTAAVGEDGIPDPDRPTLFIVMSQLGLKLEKQKAPVDFFVITHVEKPVDN